MKIYKMRLFPSKIFIFAERIKDMNIQARKLVLIEEFIHISDESLIAKLELFIKQEKKNSHERGLKPMSLNEFRDMIDHAKRDSDSGLVISQEELKKKVKSWK